VWLARCVVDGPDGEIAPGERWPRDPAQIGTVSATVTRDAYGTEYLSYNVLSLDDASGTPIFKGPSLPMPRSANRWHPTVVPVFHTLAGRHDVDYDDNAAQLNWNITNSHDLAAIGDTTSGRVGDVVSVTVGAHNNGRASIDGFGQIHGGTHAWYYLIAIPPGTETVHRLPATCVGVITMPSGFVVATDPRPGLTRYRCGTGPSLDAGASSTVKVDLKITSTGPHPAGSVSFDDPTLNGSDLRFQIDDDADNNNAALVVTPTGAGLPITGDQIAPMAIGGAALVIIGGVLYLVTRRRRP
jgi:LPXTG-motif cell wall-anchored protein